MSNPAKKVDFSGATATPSPVGCTTGRFSKIADIAGHQWMDEFINRAEVTSSKSGVRLVYPKHSAEEKKWLHADFAKIGERVAAVLASKVDKEVEAKFADQMLEDYARDDSKNGKALPARF